ncbi:unnamed protein product [Ixodes persulcatus]
MGKYFCPFTSAKFPHLRMTGCSFPLPFNQDIWSIRIIRPSLRRTLSCVLVQHSNKSLVCTNIHSCRVETFATRVEGSALQARLAAKSISTNKVRAGPQIHITLNNICRYKAPNVLYLRI